jgi:hypothetical protein
MSDKMLYVTASISSYPKEEYESFLEGFFLPAPLPVLYLPIA